MDAWSSADDVGIDSMTMPDSSPVPDVGFDLGFDAPMDDAGSDAGPNACELAGNVCVHRRPGNCASPDMPDDLHDCGGVDRQCCVPAAGGPIPCATVGGTCMATTPTMFCAPPNRVGEPELYTCPTAGEDCCLPPPPHG